MGLLTSCHRSNIEVTIGLILPVLLTWPGVWVLTQSTGLRVQRLDSWTSFVADSSTLVVKLLIPSLSHGQGMIISYFLHHTLVHCVLHHMSDRGKDGTLLVMEWHPSPWWPLLITKRGTWRKFVTNSLRIQPYKGIFIPGAAASCAFTTGVPPFGLLLLQPLLICDSHIGTQRLACCLMLCII